MKRRDLLKGALAGMSALALGPAFGHGASGSDAEAALAALERRSGGRLGVSILNVATGRRVGHRSDERFLMCSTFKLLAVAAVLARVDAGREQLQRRVVFGSNVLLDYAPVTRGHVGKPGMTVAALCEAAITLSDNTAANLLLSSMGGPGAVTAFVRNLGDPLTRLDRNEPELNHGSPGDLRDTTTPLAMLETMQRILLGNALSANSRDHLLHWLRACTTGEERLHAGVPASWRTGDKTGTGPAGEANDVAIVWPPDRKPFLITAYYVAPKATPTQRNHVLQAVGRIAASI